MRLLVHEYEARDSAEAKCVKDLDLLEMAVQADEYEAATGIDLSGFFASVAGRFTTPQAQALAAELVARRDRRRAAAALARVL